MAVETTQSSSMLPPHPHYHQPRQDTYSLSHHQGVWSTLAKPHLREWIMALSLVWMMMITHSIYSSPAREQCPATYRWAPTLLPTLTHSHSVQARPARERST